MFVRKTCNRFTNGSSLQGHDIFLDTKMRLLGKFKKIHLFSPVLSNTYRVWGYITLTFLCRRLTRLSSHVFWLVLKQLFIWIDRNKIQIFRQIWCRVFETKFERQQVKRNPGFLCYNKVGSDAASQFRLIAIKSTLENTPPSNKYLYPHKVLTTKSCSTIIGLSDSAGQKGATNATLALCGLINWVNIAEHWRTSLLLQILLLDKEYRSNIRGEGLVADFGHSHHCRVVYCKHTFENIGSLSN